MQKSEIPKLSPEICFTTPLKIGLLLLDGFSIELHALPDALWYWAV